MSCDAIRSAMGAAGDGGWPPAVTAHLATCEACVDAAIALALAHRPAGTAPASFAADVARAARLATPSPRRRSRGLIAGLVAGAVAAAAVAVWVAPASLERGALPIAAFVLACGEGLALAAVTLNADVVRQRTRSNSS